MKTNNNIHILPTDKPSRLYYTISMNGYVLHLSEAPKIKSSQLRPQHIYITSDEEIKEGDWVYYLHNSGLHEPSIHKVEKPNYSDYKPYSIHFTSGFGVQEDCKKIILTTDPILIKDGVQKIDDDFLEWFVKNPSCERVEVKDVYKTFLEGDKKSVSNFRKRYKIIIPKEEPCTCTDECLSYLTKTCKRIEEEPKQETLEEAAKSHAIYELENNYKPTKESFKLACKRNFIRGAKWQAERSYSEEEVVSFIHKFLKEHQPQLPYLIGGINMWFEHFKKK